MRRFLQHAGRAATNPILVAWTALTCIYLLLVLFMETQTLTVSMNAVRLVSSSAVGVAWVIGAMYFIWQGRPPREGYLVIGIWGAFSSDAVIGGIVVLRNLLGYRAGDDYPWFLHSATVGYFVYMTAIAAVMHLTAQTIREGSASIPRKGWIRVAAVISLGLTLALIMLFAIKGGWWAGELPRIG